VSVLNTSPTGSEASIWQSGQGPAVDEAYNIYVVTGNGSWDGVNNFSESFMKLTPRLKLLDWFTPTNHFELDTRDEDLNSSGATLIPGTHLVLGGGKEGVLYTLYTRNPGIWETSMRSSTSRPLRRTCTALSSGRAQSLEACCMYGAKGIRRRSTNSMATNSERRRG
jgi:hypothetical protein